MHAFRPISRILIVDKHPQDTVPLVRLGARERIDARAAACGPEVLAILASELPAVVLLDVIMPGMDGFAGQAAIQARRRCDPVAVLSPF